MIFLPIVERELRIRARDKSTWRMRAVAAGAAVLIGVPLLLAPNRSGWTSGRMFFYGLAGLMFLFSLFEGARQTSDSISRERREGTLGLLFLTDLKGYDVILGKLAVSSMNSFFALFAVFPVLGLALLVGGITAAEFWRMTLAISTTLLLSLAIGTWVSTRSADERRTIVTTILLLAAVTGAPVLLDVCLGFNRSGRAFFALASPVFAGYLASDAGWRAAPGRFWISQIVGLSFAAMFLAHSARIVKTVSFEEPRRRRSKPVARKRGKHQLLDQNPIAWLAGRKTTIARAVGTLLILSAFVRVWQLYAQLFSPGLSLGFIIQSTWLINTGFMFLMWFLITYLACDFFVESRRNSTLELLLCTPLPEHEFARGHREAIKRMLQWPIACWLVVTLIGPVPVWLTAMRGPGLEGFVTGALSLLLLVTDVVTVTYVGAWLAVSTRKPAYAVAKTLLWVLVLPWIAGWLLTMIYSMSFGSWSMYRLGMPLLLLVKDACLFSWAVHRLEEDFRETAVQQITGQPSRREPARQVPADEYFTLLRDPR